MDPSALGIRLTSGAVAPLVETAVANAPAATLAGLGPLAMDGVQAVALGPAALADRPPSAPSWALNGRSTAPSATRRRSSSTSAPTPASPFPPLPNCAC
ncbi:hypothetical protein [Streptomyces lunalinharesii]|uniref:NACHT N-terminal Helical domain-containing protein n=1 Tax=Streptomyces lunalinharesii TaxID=333384 RepID=A0ABN3SX00_9ACTN